MQLYLSAENVNHFQTIFAPKTTKIYNNKMATYFEI